MRPVHERKQRTIDYVCKALDLIEGGTSNSSRYRKEWEAMSDAQFTKFMEELRRDENRQMVYLEVIEFERDLKLHNIQKCAEFMKVPLYEYVAIPDLTGDPNNVTVTPEPVPVGYAHYKRMQQTVLKKNSTNIRVNKRNPKTGQVVQSDKTVRNTDVETYAMMSLGAKQALREFMGPRGDDPVMENELYTAIANNGYARLEDLTNDVHNKVSINTLNIYYLMMGMTTNLVGPIGDLPKPKK
jgi:hypothetical protein